jgi:hypothetical protein
MPGRRGRLDAGCLVDINLKNLMRTVQEGTCKYPCTVAATYGSETTSNAALPHLGGDVQPTWQFWLESNAEQGKPEAR